MFWSPFQIRIYQARTRFDFGLRCKPKTPQIVDLGPLHRPSNDLQSIWAKNGWAKNGT